MAQNAPTPDTRPATDKGPPPPRTLRPKAPLEPGPGPTRLTPLSWIVFVLLMAWNLWSFLPRPTSEVSVPYTAFVAQVSADNVSKARIVGEAISGTFTHPIQWPEPKESQKPAEVAKAESDQQSANEKPAAREQQPTGQKPASYTAFTTTFPSVVGDPSLMALLEAHHVTVDVETP